MAPAVQPALADRLDRVEQLVLVVQQARLARQVQLVQPDPLALAEQLVPAVQPAQLVLRDQLARVARPDPPAQVVQPARVEQLKHWFIHNCN